MHARSILIAKRADVIRAAGIKKSRMIHGAFRIKRKAFVGIGGDPSIDNDVVLTSVRYYPF